MRYLILVIVVLMVVLLSTFGIQNPFPVTLRFLGFQTGRVPLYILVLISTTIGFLLSVLLSLAGRIQHRLEVRRLEQRVGELEKELKDTRALIPSPAMRPLPDEPALGGTRRASS